jgi:phosphopantothenoylcysteine synthetase/decarboxylase
MNILVTAGNTQTMIDKVRCITNVFTGRTGAQIAVHAAEHGHEVTVLTSHPQAVTELNSHAPLKVIRYQTFEDLELLMAEHIQHGGYDAVIHAAAVSDYHVSEIHSGPDRAIGLLPSGQGKIKSHHPELWLRLQPAPKLVDMIRSVWGFRGLLVKFKLEVGISEDQLQTIGQQSRLQSEADILVANTLEGMQDWALLCTSDRDVERVPRTQLATRLLSAITNQLRCKEVLKGHQNHGETKARIACWR